MAKTALAGIWPKQTRQQKSFTLGGTLNCQNFVHHFSITVGSEELATGVLALSIATRKPLLTEYSPFSVKCQRRTSGVPSPPHGMLRIAAASSSPNIVVIRSTSQLPSGLISSATRISGGIQGGSIQVAGLSLGTQLSPMTNTDSPSPIRHLEPD